MISTTIPELTRELVKRPVMTQVWTDVLFLHWRYDPAVVQALLPLGAEVDTFDGSAWVGLVPFQMERIAFGPLPPVPRLGTFPEVNVRTYVRAGSRRGVWFFSLDIDRLLPAIAARTGYRLPYCTGEVAHERHGDQISTRVERRWPKPAHPASTTIRATIGSSVAGDPLTDFLTSRWGLITSGRGDRLRYAPVDHPNWPLRSASVDHISDQLIAAAGLPEPVGEPFGLYSPGVPVRVGLPRRITRG
jgi:uncharacterized protein YqjF (DUF2071 family)